MMEIKYEDIPYHWPLCFHTQCPRKNECMRFKAGLAVPADKYSCIAVTPPALKLTPCPMFHKIEIIRAAVGFRHLFYDVKQRHASEMRSHIISYLGGHGTYYRYMRGENALSPEQQQWIGRLFKAYGYNEPVTFDAYEERYRLE
ncbi:MAG: DUF6078 family protein [Prevotella sp.]|nr:DUF6078 family protein [Prevotella sp.]